MHAKETLPMLNPLEGVLLIDKARGKTSFSLITELRKMTGVRKIGHAGTLDPLATGVMILLIGKNFTRKSPLLMGQDKEYSATLCLGSATDTYDAEGKSTHHSSHIPTYEDILHALSFFQGEILQTPPMYSAKKVNGKKLYELARKNIEIPREAQKVRIAISLISYAYPHLKLHITCSKGTYVRSLAHDLGVQLNCYAHLFELKRTRCGPFKIDSCVPLETLKNNPERIMSFLKQFPHT